MDSTLVYLFLARLQWAVVVGVAAVEVGAVCIVAADEVWDRAYRLVAMVERRSDISDSLDVRVKGVFAGVDVAKGKIVNRFPQKQEQPQCYAVVLAHAKAKNDTREKIVVDFLGQALAMRYLEVIREEMGAAYSVQAQAGVGRAHLKEYRSTLQVVLPVKPDMCDDALKVVDDILNEVAQNGVEDKYLAKIKEYELKNVDEAERQNGSWLGWFRAYIEDGMDGYTNIRKTIQSVTGKDLARAAKNLLKSGNHITVVMTPED